MFGECRSPAKGVAHAAIEINYDPKKFAVRLTYTPVGPPPTAKITDFIIKPDTVVCLPKVYDYWFWHTEIESSGLILNCSRQSAADAIQITGNSKKGELLAKLPGLTPPSATVNPEVMNQPFVSVEPVPINFTPRNKQGPRQGCDCNTLDITFPNGPYNAKVNDEFEVHYDDYPLCAGLSFDRFEGTISWGTTPPAFTTLRNNNGADYPTLQGH